VHDAGGVCGGKRIRDLYRARERFAELKTVPPDGRVERAAGDQLHGDEIHIAVAVDFVNRNDVGMVQCGSGLGFLDETQPPRGIGRLLRRKHLQRHEAVETRVPRLVDHAHAALAELLEDLVVGESLA